MTLYISTVNSHPVNEIVTSCVNKMTFSLRVLVFFPTSVCLLNLNFRVNIIFIFFINILFLFIGSDIKSPHVSIQSNKLFGGSAVGGRKSGGVHGRTDWAAKYG